MPNYVQEYGVTLSCRVSDDRVACPDCNRGMRQTNTGFICDRCNVAYDAQDRPKVGNMGSHRNEKVTAFPIGNTVATEILDDPKPEEDCEKF